jgi:type III pantothenate kinase
MTLLVDVGNSAIKWAQLAAGGTLGAVQRQSHRGVAGIAAQLADQWRDHVARDAAVIACNVAGTEVGAAVEEAARTLGLQAVRWLLAQRSFDGPIALTNRYRNPAQLGADRWHCMLGACSTANAQRAARSLVVVNAGTATTVDCVRAERENANEGRFSGKFVGGVIAPGVRLMLDSLARQTAGLPSAAADSSHATDFPDNTEAAIVTGVLDAQAGLVHQIWHRFAARLHAEPRLIVTGGHAQELVARVSIAAEIEDNLVLRGLALRAQTDLSNEQ